jgi:single-strand DNA-binding protein
MNINQGMFAGNVVTSPEFKLVGDAFTPRCKFRFAQTDRRRDAAGNWTDGAPLFINVTCWRSVAENVMHSVAKGDGVVIVGKLSFHEWEKDGVKRQDYEIDASTVGVDLGRHIASIKRTRRTFADSPASGDDASFESGDLQAGDFAVELDEHQLAELEAGIAAVA